jgi:hypothetical protein
MTTATYTADDLDHSEDDTLTCYECGFGIAPGSTLVYYVGIKQGFHFLHPQCAGSVYARNRPAAKAARRAARQANTTPAAPAGISRARIAEAVHHAVCDVTGSDGFGHCALYARAGAVVASLATGREYVVNAGRLMAGTGTPDPEDAGAELHLGMDPALSGYSGREFHAWFIRRPSGAATGVLLSADPASVEVVDLSVRHYRPMAEAIGLPWQREELPPWYWGPLTGLRALRVTLSADAEMTTMLIREQPPGPVKTVVRLALEQLGRLPGRIAS